MLAFFIIGIYSLSNTSFYEQPTTIDSEGVNQISVAFQKFAGVIIGMFALSLVISIIFLILLKNFPKCMVYSMIILVLLIFAGLIIFGIVKQIWGLAIGFGIALVILIIVLFCLRDKIETGILLLKVAT